MKRKLFLKKRLERKKNRSVLSKSASARSDEYVHWMGEAMRLARRAFDRGEVPVGALVVREGRVLGRGHNRRESTGDPTHHAEIEAIRKASRRMRSWRLDGAVLYVTLEPCAMCAGACVNARIAKVIYGCADPKAGYVETLGRVTADPRLNHRCEIQGGVCEEETAEILRRFFRERRRKKHARAK